MVVATIWHKNLVIKTLYILDNNILILVVCIGSMKSSNNSINAFKCALQLTTYHYDLFYNTIVFGILLSKIVPRNIYESDGITTTATATTATADTGRDGVAGFTNGWYHRIAIFAPTTGPSRGIIGIYQLGWSCAYPQYHHPVVCTGSLYEFGTVVEFHSITTSTPRFQRQQPQSIGDIIGDGWM